MPGPHSRLVAPRDPRALAGRAAALGAALVALLLLAGGGSTVAHAEDEAADGTPKIFRWVDEDGVTHYTTRLDRVPRALRGGVATRAVNRARPNEEKRDAATEAAAASVATTAARRDERPVPPPPADDRWVGENRPPEVATRQPGSDASLGPDGSFQPSELNDQEAAALRARMEDLDLRISEVSAEIAADEDSIKELISDPGSAEAINSGEDADFMEISRRLPDRLAELRALRAERESLEGQL
jgi:hypothetical protein